MTGLGGAERAPSGLQPRLRLGENPLERGSRAKLAAHGKPRLVTVQNMLHQGQAQPRSALLSALDDIDPIEALRETRQVLGAMPGPKSRTVIEIARSPSLSATSTLPPDWPYLTAFSMRFSKTRISSSRSPRTVAEAAAPPGYRSCTPGPAERACRSPRAARRRGAPRHEAGHVPSARCATATAGRR